MDDPTDTDGDGAKQGLQRPTDQAENVVEGAKPAKGARRPVDAAEQEGEGAKQTQGVRRPMNAFLIFCKRHRTLVREKNPHLDNRSVTRILGDLWANLPPYEKASFVSLAKEYKEAFLKANPDYKWYNPEKHAGNQANAKPSTRPTNAYTVYHGQRPQTLEGSITPGKLADPSNMGGLSLLLMAGQQTLAAPYYTTAAEFCPPPPPGVTSPCAGTPGELTPQPEGGTTPTGQLAYYSDKKQENENGDGNGISLEQTKGNALIQLAEMCSSQLESDQENRQDNTPKPSPTLSGTPGLTPPWTPHFDPKHDPTYSDSKASHRKEVAAASRNEPKAKLPISKYTELNIPNVHQSKAVSSAYSRHEGAAPLTSNTTWPAGPTFLGITNTAKSGFNSGQQGSAPTILASSISVSSPTVLQATSPSAGYTIASGDMKATASFQAVVLGATQGPDSLPQGIVQGVQKAPDSLPQAVATQGPASLHQAVALGDPQTPAPPPQALSYQTNLFRDSYMQPQTGTQIYNTIPRPITPPQQVTDPQTAASQTNSMAGYTTTGPKRSQPQAMNQAGMGHQTGMAAVNPTATAVTTVTETSPVIPPRASVCSVVPPGSSVSTVVPTGSSVSSVVPPGTSACPTVPTGTSASPVHPPVTSAGPVAQTGTSVMSKGSARRTPGLLSPTTPGLSRLMVDKVIETVYSSGLLFNDSPRLIRQSGCEQKPVQILPKPETGLLLAPSLPSRKLKPPPMDSSPKTFGEIQETLIRKAVEDSYDLAGLCRDLMDTKPTVPEQTSAYQKTSEHLGEKQRDIKQNVKVSAGNQRESAQEPKQGPGNQLDTAGDGKQQTGNQAASRGHRKKGDMTSNGTRQKVPETNGGGKTKAITMEPKVEMSSEDIKMDTNGNISSTLLPVKEEDLTAPDTDTHSSAMSSNHTHYPAAYSGPSEPVIPSRAPHPAPGESSEPTQTSHLESTGGKKAKNKPEVPVRTDMGPPTESVKPKKKKVKKVKLVENVAQKPPSPSPSGSMGPKPSSPSPSGSVVREKKRRKKKKPESTAVILPVEKTETGVVTQEPSVAMETSQCEAEGCQATEGEAAVEQEDCGLRKSKRSNRGQRYKELISQGIIHPVRKKSEASEENQTREESLPILQSAKRNRKRTVSESSVSSQDGTRYKTGDFDLEAHIASLPACYIDGANGKKAKVKCRSRHHSSQSTGSDIQSTTSTTSDCRSFVDIGSPAKSESNIQDINIAELRTLRKSQEASEDKPCPLVGSQRRKARKDSITQLHMAPTPAVNQNTVPGLDPRQSYCESNLRMADTHSKPISNLQKCTATIYGSTVMESAAKVGSGIKVERSVGINSQLSAVERSNTDVPKVIEVSKVEERSQESHLSACINLSALADMATAENQNITSSETHGNQSSSHAQPIAVTCT